MSSTIDSESNKRQRLSTAPSSSASSHQSLPIPVPRRVPFYVPLTSIEPSEPAQAQAAALPEWIILDLQGELLFQSISLLASRDRQSTTDSSVLSSSTPSSSPSSVCSLSPLEFGTLWKDQDRLLLRVGSSICEGKLVKLSKPYLGTQKIHTFHHCEGDSALKCCAIVRQKILFTQRPKPIVAQLNRA
jgi:hypothetical protein